MTRYQSVVDIQWAISTEAHSDELARENILEIVKKLLDDIRFQEISDESIDIEVSPVVGLDIWEV